MNRQTYLVSALFALLMLSSVGMTACNDSVIRGQGCVDDSDCLSGRMCSGGFCMDDPDAGQDIGIDTGDGDVTGDVVEPDAGRDVQIPDVPPPRTCLAATDASIDLGRLELGARRARTVEVFNCGRLPVEVRGATLEGPLGGTGTGLLDTGNLPITLEAGEAARIVLRIAADQEGRFNGTIVVFSDAPEPVEIDVTLQVGASVAEDCIELTPLTNFGTGVVPSTTRIPVEIRNCGEAPVEVNALNISGPGAPFFATEESELFIDAGETAAIPITFTAERAGTWEALLTATTASGAEATGILFAVATQEMLPFACLRVEPLIVREATTTSEGFQNEVVVEVENCGDVELAFGAPTFDGDDELVRRGAAGEFIAFPIEFLEPGEGAVVGFDGDSRFFEEGTWRVRYRQNIINVDAAPLVFDFELTIENDDPGEACLTASPTSIDLGLVSGDTLREFAIDVTNCGDVPLTVRTVDASPEFIAAPTDLAALVEPGGVISWPGAFDARATDREGDVTGTLVIGEPGRATATVRISATIVEDVIPECVTAEPAELNLGTIAEGVAEFRNVDAFNCGEVDVEVIGGRLLPGSSRNVRSLSAGPFAIAPGERIPAIGLDISGDIVGPFTASYVLESATGATFGPFTVRGIVEADGEDCLEARPASVDFGVINAGEFDERTVTLSNCGEDVLTVETAGFARRLPFSVVFDRMFPFAIEPGEEVAFEVEAAPTLEGTFSRTITVRTGRGNLLEIPVSARVVDDSEVCAVFEPAEIDFGRLDVGEVDVVEVALVNCGTRAWLAAEVFSSDEVFSVEPLGARAAPGEAIPVLIQFTPDRSASYRANAGVFVTADDGTTVRAQLAAAGDGLSTSTGPRIRIEPTTVDFGEVRSGERATRAFQICNDGDAELRLEEFSISGADSRLFSVEIATSRVAAGDCVRFSTFFAPSGVPAGTERRFFADVRVVSNDPVNPEASLRLGGIGFAEAVGTTCLAPVDEFLPITLSPGEPARQNVDFVNCGTLPLFVGEFGAESGSMSLVLSDLSLDADDGVLEPGERVTISFNIVGLEEGSFEGAITFSASETDSPRVLDAATSLQVEVISEGACLTFEPAFVDFGVVERGEFAAGVISLRNCGDVELTIVDVNLLADVGGIVNLDTDALIGRAIAPGRSINVEVQFIGEVPGETFYLFEAQSDRGATAQLEVVGIVEDFSEDCVEVTPGFVDFGEVELGLSPSRTVRVRNCGDTTQRITRIGLGRGTSPFFELTGFDTPLPTTLLPGQSIRVAVLFEAADGGEFFGELFVNNSEGRVAGAELFAFVEEDFCEEGFAVVAPDPDGPYEPELSVVEGERVWLDVEGAGPGADFGWFVLEGDPREVEFAVDDRGQWFADFGRAGEYVLGVEWADAVGCGGFGEVFVEVRRDSTVGEGIRVVITWRTPGDPDEFSGEGADVDLHLVRDTGRRLDWNGDNDCYYGNRDTFWGCELLRDELNGLGPEIVVVPEPTEEYIVGVHYFSVPGFTPEFSTVTLRIFLDGVQVATATRNLETSGRLWPAARINGREVELLDTPNVNGFPPTLP